MQSSSGQSIIKTLAQHSLPQKQVLALLTITSNVFIDIAFTHIQPIGKHKLNNINMANIGLGLPSVNF